MSTSPESVLKIGWASADVTPPRPVTICGQFHARVSEGVKDPLTVTALALESVRDGETEDRVVLVSCDFAVIPEAMRDSVREGVRKRVPELPAECIVVSATHVHSAPELRQGKDVLRADNTGSPSCYGLSGAELGAMETGEYVAFAVEKIVAVVERAWTNRAPGGIGFGLGHAVVGHNRRAVYYGGEARMYGKTNDPNFSHIEGAQDPSVNVLATWDESKNLTGLVLNAACTAQVSEHIFQVSADYWHDVRTELRRRLGTDLYVLPQCSAAGDQSPHLMLGKAAEERMWRLSGRTQREDIGVRVADAVTATLPFIEKEIDWRPRFAHVAETVELPMRSLTEAEARQASAEAEKCRETFETLQADFEAHPEKKLQPRWYVRITRAFRRMLWFRGVAERFELQKTQSTLPTELHALRIGDVAVATNAWEYYLDYGLQIKARSPAVQTFVVQLTGPGTYVPTERAMAGKGYGAIPSSNPIGPEGGRLLANRTVACIEKLWAEDGAGKTGTGADAN